MEFFNNDLLDKARQMPDKAADEAVEAIFKSKRKDAIRKWLAAFNLNSEELPQYTPKAVKQLWTLVRAEEEGMMDVQQQASKIFKRNQTEILSMLGMYALPYCYAAADGAKVLVLSDRISADTYKRLNETGQFVLNVMSERAFAPDGKGLASIFKVRLLHATIRYHILQQGKWKSLDWGLPINQEDMAGTNLAFSLIVLRGLRKIGVKLSEGAFEGYMRHWAIIGKKLGLDQHLIPSNGKEAFLLDRRICQRHHRPSAEGRQLIDALLRCYRDELPIAFPDGYVPTYMRQMLGDPLADVLGLPPANWTGRLIKGMNLIRAVGDHFFDQSLLPKATTNLSSDDRLDAYGLPLQLGMVGKM